ncbi:hypothetical protein ACVWXL_004647 [Bradyrhizobium sp. GM22.5]
MYGVQQARRGGFLERTGGAVFFALVDALGDRPLPRNLVTSRLMTAPYVKALIRHRDREFVMSDLWEVTGFRQFPMTVAKLSSSPSTYSIWRRIDLAVKHLTTSSTRLLYLVFYTGLLIFLTSIGVVIYFLVRYLTNGIGVSGFASQIISLWFPRRTHHTHPRHIGNLHGQHPGRNQAQALHHRARRPPHLQPPCRKADTSRFPH